MRDIQDVILKLDAIRNKTAPDKELDALIRMLIDMRDRQAKIDRNKKYN